MDFYQESYCAKAFLRLLSRGSTIIAELLRLSNNIPKIFLDNSAQFKKYSNLLFGFEYLNDMEGYDQKITSSPETERLEGILFEKYADIIERFMRLFESKIFLESLFLFINN